MSKQLRPCAFPLLSIVCGIVFVSGGAMGLHFFSSWYGYTALVVPASFGQTSAPSLRRETSSTKYNALTRERDASEEAIAYLKFKYIDQNGATDSSLYKINKLWRADLIEIVAIAKSPDQAKRQLNIIVEDLRTRYAEDVGLSNRIAVRRMTALSDGVTRAERLLRTLFPRSSNITNFEFLDGAAKLEKKLARTSREQAEAKGLLSKSRLHNFELVEMHPLDPLRPIWPHRSIVLLSLGICGMMLGSLVLKMKEAA